MVIPHHTHKEAKILKLTLSKDPFEVMVTGEKKTEYRRDSKWIRSRIFPKGDASKPPRDYHYVKFTNGYGRNDPYFICFFEKTRKLKTFLEECPKYSNGLKIYDLDYKWAIDLGQIVEVGNLKY